MRREGVDAVFTGCNAESSDAPFELAAGAAVATEGRICVSVAPDLSGGGGAAAVLHYGHSLRDAGWRGRLQER